MRPNTELTIPVCIQVFKEDISNIPTLTGQPMSYNIVYLSTITVYIKQPFVYDNGYNSMVLFVMYITEQLNQRLALLGIKC